MIPPAFQEFYDPEPDYERIDAAYDARREDEERERAGFHGSMDSGFLDYQVPVDAGDGARHRATGDVGEGRLW